MTDNKTPVSSELPTPEEDAKAKQDAAKREAAEGSAVSCDKAGPAVVPSTAQSISKALQNTPVTPYASCKQTLWFSFFFDGTGNNIDADVKTKKHSNVARLYLVHQGNENMGGRIRPVEAAPFGTYRIYVPGVGTYFRAVEDKGGTDFGLGFGKLGDARINWALKQFKETLAKHTQLAIDPKNAVIEVNIAVFGFSRGAALARAFVNDFIKDCCFYSSGKVLKTLDGNCKARIRFVGIFDTVASSGVAMSGNNMGKIDAITGDTASHLKLRILNFNRVRPHSLAFAPNGKPGADPAPGKYDGHVAYGGRLNMPSVVEEVRHIVAAHEIRNSFPLDSLSIRSENAFDKPEHFYEYPFPGMHSDVGGGYRPGESGKSADNRDKLSQIPLRYMLNFGVNCGVPFLPESAWSVDQDVDFAVDDKLQETFNYYRAKLVAKKGNLGSYFNAHMKLYYQWRFQDINKKNKDAKPFQEKIEKNSTIFKEEGARLDAEISSREKLVRQAKRAKDNAAMAVNRSGQYDSSGGISDAEAEKKNQEAHAEWERLDIEFHELKARKDGLPNDTALVATTNLYDAQLINDAEVIMNAAKVPSTSYDQSFMTDRASLRPHYRGLLEAYEDEFHNNKGMRDEKLIAFFDEYVHDSLSGFGKDATLPSDPRVIYVGGDTKHDYANHKPARDERPMTAQMGEQALVPRA